MQFYHVMNRAIESRNLFEDSADYVRFVHDLYEFNDLAPAEKSTLFIKSDIGCPAYPISNKRQRKRLVDIHGWCLMKDHYHLLLSERTEGGLALFVRKLNVGYAKYYNERYARSGFVFRGKTKKIPLKTQAHYLYILHYIHLNPLDYLKGAEGWRIRAKNGIANIVDTLSYLKTYRWSSYSDYIGRKNFPSVLTTSFFKEGPDQYAKDLSTYLSDAEAEFSYVLE